MGIGTSDGKFYDNQWSLSQAYMSKALNFTEPEVKDAQGNVTSPKQFDSTYMSQDMAKAQAISTAVPRNRPTELPEVVVQPDAQEATIPANAKPIEFIPSPEKTDPDEIFQRFGSQFQDPIFKDMKPGPLSDLHQKLQDPALDISSLKNVQKEVFKSYDDGKLNDKEYEVVASRVESLLEMAFKRKHMDNFNRQEMEDSLAQQDEWARKVLIREAEDAKKGKK